MFLENWRGIPVGYTHTKVTQRQAHNQRGAIAPPKFSQTYVFVTCSKKLHHFPPQKYQLVVALPRGHLGPGVVTIPPTCLGPTLVWSQQHYLKLLRNVGYF